MSTSAYRDAWQRAEAQRYRQMLDWFAAYAETQEQRDAARRALADLDRMEEPPMPKPHFPISLELPEDWHAREEAEARRRAACTGLRGRCNEESPRDTLVTLALVLVAALGVTVIAATALLRWLG